MLRFFLIVRLFLLSFILDFSYFSELGLFLLSFMFDSFYVLELSLFLLSLEDNHYVDKTIVYKVVSYNQNCILYTDKG